MRQGLPSRLRTRVLGSVSAELTWKAGTLPTELLPHETITAKFYAKTFGKTSYFRFLEPEPRDVTVLGRIYI